MSVNGSAEQYAEEAARQARSAALAAQRSNERSEAARVIADKMYALYEGTAREIAEVRREVRKITEIVGAITVAPPPQRTAKRSEFNPTDTGSHFIVPAEQLDDLLEKRQQREDATAYRRLWKRVRLLVFALLGGAATIAGEQIVKRLLGH